MERNTLRRGDGVTRPRTDVGRHETWRAGERAAPPAALVQVAGHAEVSEEQARRAVGGQETVVGLQVSERHAARVHEREGGQYLAHEVAREALGQRAAADVAEERGQRAAVDILHLQRKPARRQPQRERAHNVVVA